MSDDKKKYEQLVRKQDELLHKIETYQEAIASIQMLVHKRGTSVLHLQTIEEILATIHSAEIHCRTELLDIRLAKSVLSNRIGQDMKN